jgi:protein phosphatase
LITPRVVLFIAAILVVLGGAAAATGWYARSGYFVGLKDGQLVVYKGRPGGVLWFEPTVAYQTSVTTSDILSRHLPELQAGQQESSLSAAREYVQRLVAEKQTAERFAAPPPFVPPTTVPKTTTTTRR